MKPPKCCFKNMNKQEILNIVKRLAKSQGFYSNLYEELINNPEYLEELSKLNIKDEVDLILYLEG